MTSDRLDKKNEELAERFQENRTHLKAVAFRMLGNRGEAEDALQEAWLRLTRSDSERIDNLGGWLTTVVARVCLDVLRSRLTKQIASQAAEAQLEPQNTSDPESDLVLADSVGPALLVVLEALTPAERVAFVLHDLFDLSFEEISPIVDRSPAATRQLASRARRKVQGSEHAAPPDRDSQREIVTAFLAASRDGNFMALLQMMDPSVVLRADDLAVQTALKNKARGAPPLERELEGAAVVAEAFKGRAKAAALALVDGVSGAIWPASENPMVAFLFTVKNSKIAAIDVVMDPARIAKLEIDLIDGENAHANAKENQ